MNESDPDCAALTMTEPQLLALRDRTIESMYGMYVVRCHMCGRLHIIPKKSDRPDLWEKYVAPIERGEHTA